MASPEDSSPNAIHSPPSSSPGSRRYPDTTGATSTSSPPASGSSAVRDAHQRTDQRRYQSKERHDRSRSRSPHQHYTSRFTERRGHGDIDTSVTLQQDMDHPPRPSRRHEYRDDDYRYSNRDGGDRYRPSPLPDSTAATGSRHSDQYQPRHGDSRYDTRRRHDDYDYPRSTYAQQQQTHSRAHYSDYRQQYDDRRYQRYHDDHYEPRSRPSRRTVERGTEEERQRSTIIFVGNLPYDYREQDVAAMFDRYGKLVKVTIPIDALTTKNKGFAFVEFEQRLNAQEAMDNFQGFSVGGRRLKLDWDIGLNKKDIRRAPASSSDHGRTRSPPRSSSPPSTLRRGGDSYHPPTDERSYGRPPMADTYRPQ